MTLKSSSDNINRQTLVIRQKQQHSHDKSVCSHNEDFKQLFHFATLPQALHEQKQSSRNSI